MQTRYFSAAKYFINYVLCSATLTNILPSSPIEDVFSHSNVLINLFF